MQISDAAIEAIRTSNACMGRLMGAFNRREKSIENWLESKDIRLTTPSAVQIIKEETGLSDIEILVETEKREAN